MTEFKLWSESNSNAKENISPKLGLRDWDELNSEDKKTILTYFINKGWFEDDYRNWVLKTILNLNEKYKKESYGRLTLSHGAPHFYDQMRDTIRSCCPKVALEDFINIILNEKQDVIFETLSMYAHNLIDRFSYNSAQKAETEEDKNKYYDKAFSIFDNFSNCFNDIAEQFSINIVLTRSGFILKQDDKITREIYEPVLTFLSDKKWEPVSRELNDAFSFYQQKTKQGYSSSVTQTVSALQAFLQITVNGKTGKGDISKLIPEAMKKGLIPNDKFTKQIFDNLEAILMTERQHTSNAHPKTEYANEKNARLVLNLVMIFFQHCIT